MEHGELSQELVTRRIRQAEERKARALAEYHAAAAELEWWLEGAQLFGIAIDPAVGQGKVTELFPPASYFDENGVQPTLRQAIVAVMRERPVAHWGVGDLADSLQR